MGGRERDCLRNESTFLQRNQGLRHQVLELAGGAIASILLGLQEDLPVCSDGRGSDQSGQQHAERNRRRGSVLHQWLSYGAENRRKIAARARLYAALQLGGWLCSAWFDVGLAPAGNLLVRFRGEDQEIIH